MQGDSICAVLSILDIKAFLSKLIYHFIMCIYKLIHKLALTKEGLEASLLLEGTTRKYILEVNLQKENY